VGNNFEKPDIEGMSSIKVYVSFVIEKDGTMTDIQVKRDPPPVLVCDEYPLNLIVKS
jgi:hypothetical protein